MSDEDRSSKTEQPTEKRKEDFRKKGDIAKSADLGSSLLLVFGSVTLLVTGSYTFRNLTKVYKNSLSNLDSSSMYGVIGDVATGFAKSVWPVLVVTMFAAALAGVMQTGGRITWNKLAPDFSRFNVVSRLKQMIFSKDSFVRLVRELIKVILIVSISYYYIISKTDQLSKLSLSDYSGAIPVVLTLVTGLVLRLLPIIFLLGMGDYIWEKYQMNEKMKMTKHEIKEEHKEQEGDPHIKGKLKQRQRAMVMNAMMKDAENADVLIVNPTEYAVALKYDSMKAPAPYLLAKGRGVVASRLRKIARSRQIPVVENKPLARLMYYNAEVGSLIPPAAYKAVALILARIFKRRRKSL
ncbi:MAG: EscU/YscU/HrcU family type III secretion system export apparatus switch protein [Deltaproteobacteria bacterium]|nr:EscU/YscU/HrcU family type III secretion system export apparatus switch protein [Deltaproteobacteria bacterium]